MSERCEPIERAGMIDTTDVREIVLDKIRVMAQEHVDVWDLNQPEWFAYRLPHLVQTMAIGFKDFVCGEILGPEEVRYPENWWEAFKERWFLGWMLKRWPVKYEVHRLTFNQLYPDWKPKLPNERTVLHVKHWQGIETQEDGDERTI